MVERQTDCKVKGERSRGAYEVMPAPLDGQRLVQIWLR